jgi:glycosyltransferase involved in cell wall biosynthesis
MLEGILYISYGLLLIIAVLMIRKLSFAAKHFTPPVYMSEIGEEVDMPSVTVCIPARNEMHAMTDCLQRVIASDYQRLEIIVLDDVSGDETSSLIKAFAHEGVRFVQGKSLPAGWLGKNHALQGLLNEASGTYVLFMDVDTRISSTAISNMVRYAMSERATMVSVLPRREDGWRSSTWLSPLRYFWEVIFHRKNFPATASNAWLIQRRALVERFNGFENLKAVVQPESHIASALSLKNEYRFLISTSLFGVAYEKKWRSQLITSTRLLFPLFGSRVGVALVAILNLLLLLIPFAIGIATFFVQISLIHLLGCALALLYAGIYGWYAHRVWNKSWIIGVIVWPLLLIQEVILILASIFQYKRRTVKWKGRTFLQSR